MLKNITLSAEKAMIERARRRAQNHVTRPSMLNFVVGFRSMWIFPKQLVTSPI